MLQGWKNCLQEQEDELRKRTREQIPTIVNRIGRNPPSKLQMLTLDEEMLNFSNYV